MDVATASLSIKIMIVQGGRVVQCSETTTRGASRLAPSLLQVRRALRLSYFLLSNHPALYIIFHLFPQFSNASFVLADQRDTHTLPEHRVRSHTDALFLHAILQSCQVRRDR